MDGNKVTRSYLLPDNVNRIWLSRNCKKCNELDFNFEHDHLKSPPPADRFCCAQSVMAEVEGYPVSHKVEQGPEVQEPVDSFAAEYNFGYGYPALDYGYLPTVPKAELDPSQIPVHPPSKN